MDWLFIAFWAWLGLFTAGLVLLVIERRQISGRRSSNRIILGLALCAAAILFWALCVIIMYASGTLPRVFKGIAHEQR